MKNRFVLMAAVAAGACWLAASAAEQNSGHLLVQLAYEQGEFKTVGAVTVPLPLPKNRDGRQVGDWRVTLSDTKGRVLFQTLIPDPRLVRAELEPPGEPPVRKTFLMKGRVDFSLRLPRAAGTLLFESRRLENGKSVWRPLGSCEISAEGGRP
jgi:hypothetical protein